MNYLLDTCTFLRWTLEPVRLSKTFILDEIQANSFSTLPITPPHVFELMNLPAIHNDPFDRILIAQSINERLTLITNDAVITRYKATVIW